MNPSSVLAPSSAVSGALLSDLLCSPVCMRADRLSAFVLPLVQQLSPRATPEQRAGALGPVRPISRISVSGEDGDEPDVMPWDEPCYSVEDGVAIVRIEGPIVKGYDNLTCWWYGCMSTDKLEQALGEIMTRMDVLAVVLVVRSPGGMATGTPEASALIAQLAAQKLVVAVTDTMACSAAYWMGCAAPTLFTTVSADVGCIGTYIALYDYTEMLKEWGIKLELFKRGKYKAIGVMGNPLDKAAREFLDRDCGRTNDRFLAAVRAHRPGVTDSTMEGQWFDGEEAVQLKLADQVVGSVAEVVARAKTAVAAALVSPAALA